MTWPPSPAKATSGARPQGPPKKPDAQRRRERRERAERLKPAGIQTRVSHFARPQILIDAIDPAKRLNRVGKS